MILYHVDRGNLLQANTTLELDSDFTNFDPGLREYLVAHFPEGISKHGDFYLNRIDMSTSDCYINDIFSRMSSFAIESSLETLRKGSFPDHPSRFQSFFAFRSLIEIWDDFKGYPVYEIEVDESMYDVRDASLLSTPFFHYMTPNGLTLTYSHVVIWQYLRKYLDGEISEKPKLECIVKYPIKVLNKVDNF